MKAKRKQEKATEILHSLQINHALGVNYQLIQVDETHAAAAAAEND